MRRRAGERMQRLEAAVGVEPEDRAQAVDATSIRRAVERSIRAGSQSVRPFAGFLGRVNDLDGGSRWRARRPGHGAGDQQRGREFARNPAADASEQRARQATCSPLESERERKNKRDSTPRLPARGALEIPHRWKDGRLTRRSGPRGGESQAAKLRARWGGHGGPGAPIGERARVAWVPWRWSRRRRRSQAANGITSLAIANRAAALLTYRVAATTRSKLPEAGPVAGRGPRGKILKSRLVGFSLER